MIDEPPQQTINWRWECGFEATAPRLSLDFPASILAASMTDYTSRVSEYEDSPVLSLAEARRITGRDLVSAREIASEEGKSYHQMEEDSESRSHQSARDEGIDFFCSVGYQVFPQGVGVRGTYTLADFLAIRGNRAVFVEVLSDTNVRAETLQRKAQLQQHGELCFVLFSGTKRADESNLVAAKHSIECWADVLYCRLDGYCGNRIEQTYKATVAYDTTRQNGIKVALAFERSGRKLAVSAKFLTHLLQNSTAIPRASPAYFVGHLSHCYEQVYLEIFQELQSRIGSEIRFTSRHRNVTAIRAMRRKAGLQMIGSDGRVTARLKSEYRGPPVEEDYMWNYHPASRDLPPDDCFGVFVLERTGPSGLRNLMRGMGEYGLTLQYSAEGLEQSLQLLAKQPRAETVEPENEN
jgi:hypothetical protein